MRSLKTKKYAKYYLLLEECKDSCIKHYNDYQKLLNETYIIQLKSNIIEKNEKISELEQLMIKTNLKLDEALNKLDVSSDKLNDVLEKLDETHNQLEETQDQLEETNEKLDNTDNKLNNTDNKLNNTDNKLNNTDNKLNNTDNKLNIVAKKLDIATEDRVVRTRKSAKLEYFSVMKNDSAEYKYYIIRGQKRYIDRKKAELDSYTEIKRLECVPNASMLWNYMKEEFKGSKIPGSVLHS